MGRQRSAQSCAELRRIAQNCAELRRIARLRVVAAAVLGVARDEPLDGERERRAPHVRRQVVGVGVESQQRGDRRCLRQNHGGAQRRQRLPARAPHVDLNPTVGVAPNLLHPPFQPRHHPILVIEEAPERIHLVVLLLNEEARLLNARSLTRHVERSDLLTLLAVRRRRREPSAQLPDRSAVLDEELDCLERSRAEGGGERRPLHGAGGRRGG